MELADVAVPLFDDILRVPYVLGLSGQSRLFYYLKCIYLRSISRSPRRSTLLLFLMREAAYMAAKKSCAASALPRRKSLVVTDDRVNLSSRSFTPISTISMVPSGCFERCGVSNSSFG